jgi:hypothetical protein
MATTVTLDDDVADRLEALRRERDVALDALVNELIRDSLEARRASPGTKKPFRTPTADPGRSLIGNIVSVSEAIAKGEGDWHR